MARLRLEFHSFWHAGSGRGRGAQADALLVRTPAGLPYLPGRTLKGVVRDAMLMAEQAGQIAPGRTDQLFGKRAEPSEEDMKKGLGRFQSRKGMLRFSDARIGDNQEEQQKWELFATTVRGRKLAANLFKYLSSTALDDQGLARKRSLRTLEVCIPLVLWADVDTVDGADPGQWREDLETSLPLVRALGAKRTRGLGRCRLQLLEDAP